MSTTATDENVLTAGSRSVDFDGTRLVERRFGNAESQAPPLLCLQHFRGNLDNWNRAFVDRIARKRQVMLLDNRGTPSSRRSRAGGYRILRSSLAWQRSRCRYWSRTGTTIR